MPRARDGGTAQGKYDVVWLVFIYPEPSPSSFARGIFGDQQ